MVTQEKLKKNWKGQHSYGKQDRKSSVYLIDVKEIQCAPW